MKQRGFALLAVLWVVAILGGALLVAGHDTRAGLAIGRNRAALVRGRWAAEACGEIARAHVEDRARDPVVDLGRRVHCRWRVEDPGGRLNVNEAPVRVLERLFVITGADPASAELTARTLGDRRAQGVFTSLEDVAEVPGFPSASLPFLATEGPRAVSAAVADATVLAALPGMTAETAHAIVGRRFARRPIADLDELSGLVSPAARAELAAHHLDLRALLAFAPVELRVVAEGWVGDTLTPPVVRLELFVIRNAGRLNVVRRRLS